MSRVDNNKVSIVNVITPQGTSFPGYPLILFEREYGALHTTESLGVVLLRDTVGDVNRLVPLHLVAPIHSSLILLDKPLAHISSVGLAALLNAGTYQRASAAAVGYRLDVRACRRETALAFNIVDTVVVGNLVTALDRIMGRQNEEHEDVC